jgi:hypothetical protein
MPILGIMASAMSANLFQPAGAYDALSTVTVPAGGVASITFAGIPTGYKHLQIRAFARSTVQARLLMQVNSATSGYAVHYLLGDGASASAGAAANTTHFAMAQSQADANIFSASIVDLLDYSNTAKNKTVRILAGNDKNGSGGEIALWSGVYMNTSEITSAKLYFDSSANIAQYSQFSLYGVR